VGILSSEYEGERSFVTLYGFTEILPGRITTDKIVSSEGDSFFDMLNNKFKLGDKDSGIDWNDTEANQLTLSGVINALGAVLGGFGIDNEQLRSLKENEGKPHILLDGIKGTASFGSEKSQFNVTEDGRVEARMLHLIDVNGNRTDAGLAAASLTLKHPNTEERVNIHNGNSLYIESGVYNPTKRIILTIALDKPTLNIYNDNSGGEIAVIFKGLPTSPGENPKPGNLWRDGEFVKIVP